ncbi:aminodeoxychorismate lyase PabC [Methyloglobulus morosus KoM1]|uniref:Aminodeoxychorismate lyase n=1 Tax=Methyloglobulus morosus KoM1 TaxID=1116472 RepID=V5BQM8_9GAMM|nr:aminodeoxychorismate lyase [Methyloglobulus morosus]ESS68477.1 aminodeoxychorismate lyase PabC [Methyloglobulus morosus KoM1]
MILINGIASDCISVNDRGFQYGDGLFETIEVIDGQPIFLQQHLLRLSKGCSKLIIPSPDINQLADEIRAVCKQAKLAVLKIIVTRGSGGRGYRQPEAIQPTCVLSLHPFPDYPKTYAEQGINARFCDTRLGLNPALAGIKHLNRLEQIMARAEWDDPDIQEGIMRDINGHVIEGTMTNLFYVKEDITYTATLKLSGVTGVLRGIVMQLLREQNCPLIEQDYSKEELLAADEIFVCNAIIGIWPVKQIGDANFAIGKLTGQLQAWLAKLKRQTY